MIIDHNNGLQKISNDLTPDEVIRKTDDALNDPTVTRIEIAPRWERRKQEREATKKRGKRRTYR